MFKKLLSNLAFNPSLIGQVSFYAKRLHTEAAVRRTGFVLIALTMVVQMFAVISPPQASLQASPNMDLVTGGFSTKQQAVEDCKRDVQDYKKILAYFAIDCADISNSSVVDISPKDHNNNLYSMGRTNEKTDTELGINIPGAGKFWARKFSEKNHNSSYKALRVTNAEGHVYYVLFGCGNIVTIGVPKPPKICQWNDDLLASDSKCFEPCPISGKHNLPKSSPQCFEPCPYAGKKNIPASNAKCFEPCPVKGKEALPRSSPQCFEPCQYNSLIAKNSDQCKPCEQSQTKTDATSCLELHKAAKNVTQNLSDANGTTAHGGDVIEYTLTTKNTGKATIKGYQVSDPFGDVLDYATITDLHGGTLNSYALVTWPKEDIKAGATATHMLTIKIKDPIPQTPASSSDPTHFDMQMTNVYGNAIEIDLPKTPIKEVEIVTTRLPNTGPGSSLIIGFSLTLIIGYFFARSRLLAKELDIVRADYTSAGGY